MRTLLLATLAQSALASGAPFPVGLYNTTSTAALVAAADSGFTVADVRVAGAGRQFELAGTAARLGLAVMARPDPDFLRSYRTARIRVAAWHLSDEPEVYGTPAASISALDREVKLSGSLEPTVVVIGTGGAAAHYAEAADRVMLDWYPVPHLSLASLAEQMDAVRRAAPGKQLWVVLQAMDWRDYPQRDPSRPRIGRFPSRDELRYMTLSALAHGARGIFFYTFTRPDGRTLLDEPSQWGLVRDAARMVREWLPFLEAGEGTILPAVPGRTVRRWKLGRRTLTVAVDADPPSARAFTSDR